MKWSGRAICVVGDGRGNQEHICHTLQRAILLVDLNGILFGGQIDSRRQ